LVTVALVVFVGEISAERAHRGTTGRRSRRCGGFCSALARFTAGTRRDAGCESRPPTAPPRMSEPHTSCRNAAHDSRERFAHIPAAICSCRAAANRHTMVALTWRPSTECPFISLDPVCPRSWSADSAGSNLGASIGSVALSVGSAAGSWGSLCGGLSLNELGCPALAGATSPAAVSSVAAPPSDVMPCNQRQGLVDVAGAEPDGSLARYTNRSDGRCRVVYDASTPHGWSIAKPRLCFLIGHLRSPFGHRSSSLSPVLPARLAKAAHLPRKLSALSGILVRALTPHFRPHRLKALIAAPTPRDVERRACFHASLPSASSFALSPSSKWNPSSHALSKRIN